MSDRQITRRNVLVIDDDAIMRELLTVILGMEGYDVQLVESGEEALELLSSGSEKVDVILVDLHMPGVQGAELAGRLNAVRGPEMLLIGMSGSKLDPGHAGLFDGFLQKPFAVEDFAEVVETARAGRETGEATAGHPAKMGLDKTGSMNGMAVLDEAIYGRLATILPAAQLRELYRITIEDVLRRVQLMRADMERGNMEQCRNEAHAIKGGCGMVGATELSALAAVFEGGAEADIPRFADFDAACARLQDMLDARI